MKKVINKDAHCSECVHFWSKCPYMYCTYLKRRITARKTPKYCKGYKTTENEMIDNFDLIKSLLTTRSGNNTFFHLQILRRGKDHPDLPAANKLIRKWLVRDATHLEKIKDDVVFLCEHYKARAYINVAGKDLEKLNALVLSKLANNAFVGNVADPFKVCNSACGELLSKDKVWIIDIDTMDLDSKFEVLEEIDGIWLDAHPEHKELLNDLKREETYLIAEVPTMNGCHLLTRPFNLQKFKALFPNVDVHKNNPTILYIPKSIET